MSWVDNFTIVLTTDVESAEVGIWCEKCLLPSAMKVPMVGMLPGGISQIATLEFCVDCDENGEGAKIDAELDCG